VLLDKAPGRAARYSSSARAFGVSEIGPDLP
jgi:hypothetical protein